MREARGIALHHADSGSAIAATGDLFDTAVVEACRGGTLVFRKDFREFGTGTNGSAENPGERVGFDHGLIVSAPLAAEIRSTPAAATRQHTPATMNAKR